MLPSRRPHIVLVVADDFPWELWPRAENAVTMAPLLPSISANLVRDGLSLRHAYGYRLCAPARASLLSGRWPHRAYELEGGMRACKGLSPGFTSLAEKLRDGAGYRCVHDGKWHLGYVSEDYCPWRRGVRAAAIDRIARLKRIDHEGTSPSLLSLTDRCTSRAPLARAV
jgi:arylsulfatase A-like enzyme